MTLADLFSFGACFARERDKQKADRFGRALDHRPEKFVIAGRGRAGVSAVKDDGGHSSVYFECLPLALVTGYFASFLSIFR